MARWAAVCRCVVSGLVFMLFLPLALGALAGAFLPSQDDPDAETDSTDPTPLTEATRADMHPGYDPFGDRPHDTLLLGSDGANLHEGSPLAEEIHARAGNDVLRGAGGDDSIDGAAGDDRIAGDDGDDWLDGGVGGTDHIWGGTGDDVILNAEHAYGGAGDDVIGFRPTPHGNYPDFVPRSPALATLYGTEPRIAHGGDGDDVVIGSSGADLLDGGPGDDKLIGLDGDDRLFGGAGDDRLVAQWGSNMLDGGDGNDTLYAPARTAGAQNSVHGGEGDDTLVGVQLGGALPYHHTDIAQSLGTVRLDGGAGDDHITFDANNTVTGGAGADVFAMVRSLQSLERAYTDSQIPRITDFEQGTDRLVLDVRVIHDSFPALGTDLSTVIDIAVAPHAESGGTVILVNGTPGVIVEGVAGLTEQDVVVQHEFDRQVALRSIKGIDPATHDPLRGLGLLY